MVQADETFHERLSSAIEVDLVAELEKELSYAPLPQGISAPFQLGEIEDANVLIQNSLWQNAPLGELAKFSQLKTLQNRGSWAKNQLEQISLLGEKFTEIASRIDSVCKPAVSS